MHKNPLQNAGKGIKETLFFKIFLQVSTPLARVGQNYVFPPQNKFLNPYAYGRIQCPKRRKWLHRGEFPQHDHVLASITTITSGHNYSSQFQSQRHPPPQKNCLNLCPWHQYVRQKEGTVYEISPPFHSRFL